MNKLILSSLICFLAAIHTTAKAQSCASTSNIYTFTYSGHNYEIVKEFKTWANAATCAVARGGYLAEINSQAEQDTVFDAIINKALISPSYTSVADGGGSAYIWIGATDKNAEGTWLWDGNNDNVGIHFWTGQGNAGAGGGSAFAGNYIHWGGTTSGPADEPDDYLSNQDGGAICLSSWPWGIAGEWNDIALTNSLYYVIEYNSSASINSINNSDTYVVNVFPNPSSKIISISTGNSLKKMVSASVSNQLGAVVYKQIISKSNTATIDVSSITSGIYTLTIYFEDGTSVNKSVVIK
jgi:hypothetical protein